MPTSVAWTYDDAIQHVLEYDGGDNPGGDKAAYRSARRAVQTAYRELSTVRRWSYYQQVGGIVTNDDYSTGTIAYDHTGGAEERYVTLSSGTFPTWAVYGVLVIDDVPYEVATYEDTTHITLSVNTNPGADVSSGETYTLYRDTYPMPVDFIAADQFIAVGTSSAVPQYLSPGAWLERQQGNLSVGTPRYFTFTNDPNYQGVMAVRFWPPPDAAYTFRFIYHRRPRPLIVESYKTGTVTATSGSTTLPGSGTVWTSAMIGSTIRFSANAVDYPTGREGANPFAYERTIMDVATTTSLTLDSSLSETLTGVKYVISDPVDIEDGAMLVAFQRGCEKQLSIFRNKDSKRDAFGFYDQALERAREADARFFGPRSPGGVGYRLRLADHPAGSDQGA